MLTTGFDLGIFDQAVRFYAHGHMPMVRLEGPNADLLGDHFSPIIATLAPLYLLWPSAYLLLLAQAALFAVGAVPITRWAVDELGARAALAVGAGYGASWGIASAAGFDFHEIAFGVPLLALSATALGRRRLRAAAAWALPLLLVKEDLGITVAVVGILIATRGARLLGLATVAIGVVGTALEVAVFIPAVNHSGYSRSGMILGGPDNSESLPMHLLHELLRLQSPEVKVLTVVLLFAPTAFLALRSPLAWLVVPTLTWRFLADDPYYWGTGLQYSAVLMPVVSAAYVEALIKWRRDAAPRTIGASSTPRGMRATLAIGLAVTLLLAPSYPLSQLARPRTWHTAPSIGVARQMLAVIPDGATVAASNRLAPQLTDRTTVALLDPRDLPSVDWIAEDTAAGDAFPLTLAQRDQMMATAEHEGFHVVLDGDGYVILRR